MSEARHASFRTLVRVCAMMGVVLMLCFGLILKLRTKSQLESARADEAGTISLIAPQPVHSSGAVTQEEATMFELREPDRPWLDTSLSLDPTSTGVGLSLIDLQYQAPPFDGRIQREQ